MQTVTVVMVAGLCFAAWISGGSDICFAEQGRCKGLISGGLKSPKRCHSCERRVDVGVVWLAGMLE